ncbi:tyrosine-type recombinase/integrase [Nitrospira sp. Nam74]
MGLTKRKDSWYVEFRVIDDGKAFSLAPYGTGKLKRWKVGCLNKGEARKQEAIIKTRLLSGQEVSPSVLRLESITFQEWASTYLELEEVRRLRSYRDRLLKVKHLVSFFGDKLLCNITAQDVEEYRKQRCQYDLTKCPHCQQMTGFKRCQCGWERKDEGRPVSVQSINHDHTALTHMLNVAKSPRYKLIVDNPASHVPKPDADNWRDRVATTEEWLRLKQHAAPHLVRYLAILYSMGPRKSELLKLEWPDVDMRRKEFRLRETKNGEPRVVPMTDEVYGIFKELWQERRLDYPKVFLYKGKPWKSPRTAYLAACRRAGIQATGKEGLHIHDFRHTASTNLRRAGVDTMTAMKVVGHKSEQMHRRYNQITPDDLKEAAARLTDYQTNTLITLANSPAVGHNATRCNSGVGA